MKRIAFIISLILVLSCDKNSNDPIGAHDEGYLEVTFTYNGSEVDDIELSPQMQTIEIAVGMSHEAIGWKVSSDQEWCVVDNAQTHTGSSKFSVSVPANIDLTDRSVATITLKAGYYKKDFQIRQRGKVVVVDKVYSLSNSSAGLLDLAVKYRDGVKWSIDSPQWVRTEVKGTQPCEDGILATVSVEWDANASEARYGTLGFINDHDDVPSEYFSLYQLGSEYSSTDNGSVIIAGKDAEAMEIKMPAGFFNDIEACDWVSASDKSINEDGTETWTLKFSDNISDVLENIGKSRSKTLKLLSAHNSADVTLPEFSQDYCSAGGLMSVQGLKSFAKTYREAGDLNIWMSDDKIMVLNDLDLTDLVDWTSIGTEMKPFTLKLDGCGNTISGFKSSASLLGVCENTTISNLTFDNTCELSLQSSFDRDCYLAPLAEKVSNTTISNCESSVKVSLAGSAEADGLKVYVGGLVAVVEGDVSVSGCRSKSDLTIQYIPKSDQSFISVGGAIGYAGKDSKFTVSDTDWDGNIIYHVNGGDVVGVLSVGGVIGLTDESVNLTVDKATAKGKIKVDMKRRAHNWKATTAFGGVVGAALTGGIIRNCINDCEFVWENETTNSSGYMFAMGGIVGRIENGTAVISTCTNNAPLINRHWNNNGWADRFKAHKTGGIIGGYGTSDQLDKSTSNIRIENCHNTSKVLSQRGFTGGIAGYLVNAKVTGCSFTGDCKADGNANPYLGGIVGGVQNSVIKDSEVRAYLSSFSGGSCDSRAGGVVGLLYSASEVSNCFYSGDIVTGDNGIKEVYFGGIAADTETSCIITGCGFNGSILGQNIDENNFDGYITGDREAVIEDNNVYWEVLK